jgi:hypothetical protein
MSTQPRSEDPSCTDIPERAVAASPAGLSSPQPILAVWTDSFELCGGITGHGEMHCRVQTALLRVNMSEINI